MSLATFFFWNRLIQTRVTDTQSQSWGQQTWGRQHQPTAGLTHQYVIRYSFIDVFLNQKTKLQFISLCTKLLINC